MARTRQLTERQKKFAELLIWNNDELSPSQCAEQAGYKTRARQSASELRNPRLYPQVVEYIRELHQERMEKYKVTKDTHIKRLADMRIMSDTTALKTLTDTISSSDTYEIRNVSGTAKFYKNGTEQTGFTNPSYPSGVINTIIYQESSGVKGTLEKDDWVERNTA